MPVSHSHMLPEVHPELQVMCCSLYSLYCLGLKCFCCSGQMLQYRGGKIEGALKCVGVATGSEFSNFVYFIHFYLIVVLIIFIKDGLTKASFFSPFLSSHISLSFPQAQGNSGPGELCTEGSVWDASLVRSWALTAVKQPSLGATNEMPGVC